MNKNNPNDIQALKAERDNLLRKNQFYVSQVSQMEVKLSEMRALIQANDSEIEYYKHQLNQAQNKCPSSKNKETEALEAQIIYLKEENLMLVTKLESAEDLTDLKIKFDHAIRMKQIFEEKYREAKAQLLSNEMKYEDASIFETSVLEMGPAQSKYEDLYEKIKSLELETRDLYDENEKITHELQRKDEIISELNERCQIADDKIKLLKKSRKNDSMTESFNDLRNKRIINKPENDEIKFEINKKIQKREKFHEEDSTTPYRPFVAIADRILRLQEVDICHEVKPYVPSSDRNLKLNSILKYSTPETSRKNHRASSLRSSSPAFEKPQPISQTQNKSQSIYDNKPYTMSFNQSSSSNDISFADEFPDEDELM